MENNPHKKICHQTITHDDMVAVKDKLNNRPRKCLGSKTPDELAMSKKVRAGRIRLLFLIFYI
jgi:IS30 family transposase